MAKVINFDYGGANIYRMTPIGKRLRDLRKSLGLNQEAVAELIGVNQSMISDYESKGVMFDADKLMALAEVLHTTMDFIMYGDSATDPDEAWLVGHFRAMAPDLRAALLKSASAFAAVPPKSGSVAKRSGGQGNREAA